MIHKPRKTVADTAALCHWAATAPAGDFVVYHVGNLGRDRADLSDPAACVAAIRANEAMASRSNVRLSIRAIAPSLSTAV